MPRPSSSARGVQQHPVAGLAAGRSAPGRRAPARARRRRSLPARPRPAIPAHRVTSAANASPLRHLITPPAGIASVVPSRGQTGSGEEAAMSTAEDRAAAGPGGLPAVQPAVPDRDPDPRRRARLPGVLRGVQADVRAGQGRTPRAGHPAGDGHQRGAATTRRATASRGRPTCCPTSGWSRTRPRCCRLAARVWRRAELAGAAAGRAAEAARRRGGGRGDRTAGDRAAAAGRRGRVRRRCGRRYGTGGRSPSATARRAAARRSSANWSRGAW